MIYKNLFYEINLYAIKNNQSCLEITPNIYLYEFKTYFLYNLTSVHLILTVIDSNAKVLQCDLCTPCL